MGVWVAKNACVATLMPEPNPVTIRPAMSQSMPTVGLQSATMAGAVAYITPPIACAYTDGGQAPPPGEGSGGGRGVPGPHAAAKAQPEELLEGGVVRHGPVVYERGAAGHPEARDQRPIKQRIAPQ